MDQAFTSPENIELSKSFIEAQKHLQPTIKDVENAFAKTGMPR